jgi:tetratricopeptide (TPR) repeat protein
MENLADLLLAQINIVPKRPSEVRPGAGPKSLEDVIMRCLEKEASKRYANMAELEAALCEAQIAAGVTSEWDDLPLPDIEPERRAALLAKMPSLHAELAPRRRWLLPAVAAVGAAAVTGIVLMLIGAPEVPPEVVAQIETLSQEARDAAAVGHYVLAPEKDEAVAYKKVVALEDLEGPGEELADKAGETLRKEFSAQLLTVADKFWNQEATKPLAYDYYDWVLWFDKDNALALERSNRTEKERNEMYDRMMNDKLRESEIMGMTIASAGLAPEAEKKSGRWKKQLAAATVPLSKTLAVQEAMRGAGLAPAEPAKVETKVEPVPVPVPEPVPDPDPVIVDPPVVEPDPVVGKKPASKGGKKKPDEDPEGEVEAASKRDPAKASELAGQGTAALNAGRRAEAEGLFNQAISHDRKCAEALIGLSDVYFDRGSSTKAQRYAEQAVAIAPNNGSYRIKLGDAYYNALRYRDALTQYEKAQSLGDSKAAPRIAKVKSKLGE